MTWIYKDVIDCLAHHEVEETMKTLEEFSNGTTTSANIANSTHLQKIASTIEQKKKIIST